VSGIAGAAAGILKRIEHRTDVFPTNWIGLHPSQFVRLSEFYNAVTPSAITYGKFTRWTEVSHCIAQSVHDVPQALFLRAAIAKEPTISQI